MVLPARASDDRRRQQPPRQEERHPDQHQQRQRQQWQRAGGGQQRGQWSAGTAPDGDEGPSRRRDARLPADPPPDRHTSRAAGRLPGSVPLLVVTLCAGGLGWTRAVAR